MFDLDTFNLISMTAHHSFIKINNEDLCNVYQMIFKEEVSEITHINQNINTNIATNAEEIEESDQSTAFSNNIEMADIRFKAESNVVHPKEERFEMKEAIDDTIILESDSTVD